YIVSDDDHHCFIVDPGDNGKKVIKFLNDNELILDAILLTHGHFDHIGAVDYIYEHCHCPIYIHQEDITLLHDAKANLSIFEVPFVVNAPVIASNEKMKIGNFEINWLHLPGHCPGSSMIYLPKESVIFSGDVLFNGSIGRFDFPNSSKHDTSTSLNKIKEYDFDAIVYPGHGPATSLKQEQASNPYL
ncbi:MAG: MBL fold metallo-hydrolase, partial [Thomasclavelia spiroformis]